MNLNRIEVAGIIFASVTLVTEVSPNAVTPNRDQSPTPVQEPIGVLCLITSLLRV
jgi:hypothetical protein